MKNTVPFLIAALLISAMSSMSNAATLPDCNFAKQSSDAMVDTLNQMMATSASQKISSLAFSVKILAGSLPGQCVAKSGVPPMYADAILNSAIQINLDQSLHSILSETLVQQAYETTVALGTDK